MFRLTKSSALARASSLFLLAVCLFFDHSASTSSAPICTINKEQHAKIDAQITDDDNTSLIKGASEFAFGKESKEEVMFAMAGKENHNVIVLSMPGVMLGPLDIGYDTSNSSVFVSVDGGVTFTPKVGDGAAEGSQEFYGRKDNGLQPSPIDKLKIIVIGYGLKAQRMRQSELWITEDAGASWKKNALSFRVDGPILFHRYDPDLLLAYSRYNGFSVHLSKDFGKTWTQINKNVRSVHWGIGKTIFATVDEGVGVYGSPAIGRLMMSADLGETWTEKLAEVHSFGVEGAFIYASVSEGGDVQNRILKVSSDNGESWNHVQLPNISPDRFYSILDMSEGLIFIHVSNPRSADHGTLYTSGSNGTVFSESLDRHLFTHNTLTDFYRVKGMRGIFITAQVNKDLSLTTLITYNRGATWQRIDAPANENAKCNDDAKCSLQLHVAFSRSEYGAAPQGPLSIDNATGLIIAHGHVGDSLGTKDVKVYISSDGGVNWRHTGLNGFYFYQILDYGGLIVAVKIPRTKDEGDEEEARVIYFSTDEGHCWHSRNYTHEDILVKGLRADPNGHSLLVSVWGMKKGEKEGSHEWVVITIDFSKILTKNCEAKDYVDWSPTTGGSSGCYLGEKFTYKRLKKDSFCHNDPTILEKVTSKPCPCQRSDFDCAYGYERNVTGQDCFLSTHIHNQAERPMLCLQGQVYAVEGQKYRKIPGDKCEESSPDSFKPASHGLTLVKPPRKCEEGSKAFLEATPAPSLKTPAQKTALAAIVCVSLLLFSLCTIFFARKFVSLRNDKGSYRYSSVRATDDDEFEALLPGGDSDRSDANGGFGDYVVAADDEDDFDLEMELERGLAQLSAPLPSSSSTTPKTAASPSPPELPVSASKSPLKAPSLTPNVRSYLSDSDDDLIA